MNVCNLKIGLYKYISLLKMSIIGWFKGSGVQGSRVKIISIQRVRIPIEKRIPSRQNLEF
jgi:hypothetical protein